MAESFKRTAVVDEKPRLVYLPEETGVQRGVEALVKALGPVEAVRFLSPAAPTPTGLRAMAQAMANQCLIRELLRRCFRGWQFDPMKNYLIDMDGVLISGVPLFPADQFIERLKRQVEFLVLTNNPLYTPGDLAHRLQTMGLDIPSERIFTSAMATAFFGLSKAEGHGLCHRRGLG